MINLLNFYYEQWEKGVVIIAYFAFLPLLIIYFFHWVFLAGCTLTQFVTVMNFLLCHENDVKWFCFV